MSDFSDAINSLRAIDRFFKGLVDALPELEKIDSLENHIVELASAVEVRKDELTEVLAQIEQAKEDLKAEEDLRETRKVEFSGWVVTEKGKAAQEAQGIINEAQVNANNLVAEAQARTAEIEATNEGLKKILVDLQEQIAKAQMQYETIQNKLAEIKSSI